MRSFENIARRVTAVELLLAASILSGCTDATSPPIVTRGMPSTIDVAFCTLTGPHWVAFQDADGDWTQATPSVVGNTITYRGTFYSSRAAIATVQVLPNRLTSLDVLYGIPAELAIVGDTNPAHCGPVLSKTLLGSVAGLDTNETATINAGFGSRDLTAPREGNTFALRGLISGPQDVLAARSTSVNGVLALTRVILRRAPELPDSTTIPVLDFNSPESFAPVVANVTVNGITAEGAASDTRLHTAYSESILTFLTGSARTATRPYYAIPEARLRAGDLQVLSVTANPTSGNTIRSSTLYFRSPVDQTLTLGAEVESPAITVFATAPALRLRARFSAQSDYDRITGITYQQGSGTLITVQVTAAYAGLSTAGYDLLVPDLSHVAGFDATWALRAGTDVFWIGTRRGGTLGLGQNGVPADGGTARDGVVFGDYTP